VGCAQPTGEITILGMFEIRRELVLKARVVARANHDDSRKILAESEGENNEKFALEDVRTDCTHLVRVDRIFKSQRGARRWR